MLVCNCASAGGGGGATVLGRNCSIILSSLSPFMGHCSSTTTALSFPFQCSALHLKLFCCSSIYISLQCLAFVFCSTPPHFTELTLVALSAMGPCICYREIQTSTPNVCPVQNFFKTWHMLYTLPPLFQAGVKK